MIGILKTYPWREELHLMSKFKEEFEILELGEDGSFEIPSPTRLKIEEDSDDEVENCNIKERTIFKEDKECVLGFVENPTQSFKELIADLTPGSFKIMDSKNSGSIIVLIAFEEKEKATKVYVSNTKVEVKSSKERTFTVDLPIEVEPKTATSATFENFIYVNAKKS